MEKNNILKSILKYTMASAVIGDTCVLLGIQDDGWTYIMAFWNPYLSKRNVLHTQVKIEHETET